MSTTDHPTWVQSLKQQEEDRELDFVREYDLNETTLDIIESTLLNCRYEMDRTIETTAFSPAVREQSDQFPLIADKHGRMIAGQFGAEIPRMIEESQYEVDDLKEGDIIATNDPYLTNGAISHLPDMMLLRPIFYEGELVGYGNQWANLIDVGGKSPGGYPIEATSIYEEGMQIPPVKLFKGGELDRDLLNTFTRNTRMALINEADIQAIAAGTKVAEERVKELCERFGTETYLEACDAILHRTREGVTELFERHIPEHEEFEFHDFVDDDGQGHGPIRVGLKMYRDGPTLYFDLGDSDPNVPGTVNFVLNKKMLKMFIGLWAIMIYEPGLTFNDGFYDRVQIHIPEASIVQPEYPKPVSNRLPTMITQQETLQGVIAKAFGEDFSASGGYGTAPNFVYAGIDSEENPFQIFEILYGGMPARRTQATAEDGLDGHSWWPEFYTVPVEYIEAYYPLRIDYFNARPDSGGAGELRGGHGVKRIYTFLTDGQITFQDDRAHTRPWGINGGKPADTSGKVCVRNDGTREELPSKGDGFPVNEGDQFIWTTAGGGGIGDPLNRDPERVATEVRRGLISSEGAKEDYGVIVDKNGYVDEGATANHRQELRETRTERPAVDYGDIDEKALSEKIKEEREQFRNEYTSFPEWEKTFDD